MSLLLHPSNWHLLRVAGTLLYPTFLNCPPPHPLPFYPINLSSEKTALSLPGKK